MRTPDTARAAADTAAAGRALLAERVAAAPDFVARIPERFPALVEGPSRIVRGPRCLVTTGIGTSEGHARHLAEVAARFCGQPARFASTGALSAAAPPGAAEDWLVVFSQGLSANARHALAHAEAWGRVVLVTGLLPSMTEADGLSAEKRAWLDDLAARDVTCLDLGCGAEYGALVRVIGARAGYAIGWSLLRSLAAIQLADARILEVDAEALRRAQEHAPAEATRVFEDDASLGRFFAADRSLLIAAEGGVLELADQLTLKLAEGLLRPQPRTVDVLQFAHGPLQSLARRATSILYLAPREASAESEAWLARFAGSLDPALHDLRVVRAELPWPFASVEYEAIFDAFLLRGLAQTGRDVVAWPGSEREAALYASGPDRLAEADAARSRGPRPTWEERVWPEVESLVAGGRRTALLGLGSIEQHGPHLPLGTDRWIADALLEGLEARLDDAVAIPAIPIGCASEHLDFAGTLHVEEATLEAILVDLCASLVRHGFERAFLFTAHGGNLDALGAMGERLVAAARPLDLRIETDLRVGAMQSAAVEAEALSPQAAGPHAGEYETSLVAHLRPGRVRAGQLVPGRLVAPGEAQGLFYPSLRPNAETGVLGDPSAASAERGARYLKAWLDLLESGYRAAFPTASGSAEKKRQ